MNDKNKQHQNRKYAIQNGINGGSLPHFCATTTKATQKKRVSSLVCSVLSLLKYIYRVKKLELCFVFL